MRVSTFIAALVSVLIMAGCGIKGALYLPEIPERPNPQASPPPGSDHNKQSDND